MKKIQYLRHFFQIIGILLAISAFFINTEMATLFLIIITLLGGAFHCAWLCPMGSLQESLNYVGKKLGLKQKQLPRPLHSVLLYVRYILFILAFIIGLDIIINILSNNPKSTVDSLLIGRPASITALTILAVFSILSLWYKRPFCNYLCPEGAKYGLLSLSRPITVVRNASSCIHCQKCNQNCPMHIDIASKASVRSAQCINCFECVSQCPIKNTLTYQPFKINKSELFRYLLSLTLGGLLLAFYYLYPMLSLGSPMAAQENLLLTSSAVSLDIESTTAASIIDAAEKVLTEKALESQISSDSAITSDNSPLVDTSNDSQLPTPAEKTQTSSDSLSTKENTPPSIISKPDATDSPAPSVAVANESKKADTTASGSYIDGTFSGTGMGYRGNISVSITIKNGKITSISVTESRDDSKWLSRAESGVIDAIVASQTASVDTVSGATFSSEGIIDAVADALSKAQ